MEQKFFHGSLQPDDLAESLLTHFNRGSLIATKSITDKGIYVHIKTKDDKSSGGTTALTIFLQSMDFGVMVQVGQQTLAGIAARLGTSAIATLINPRNIIHRIDDIAQDIEYLQLSDELWKVLEARARTLGSGYELSERFKRQVCEYCLTPNPYGKPSCVACGAPMGFEKIHLCSNCGFALKDNVKYCPNCRKFV